MELERNLEKYFEIQSYVEKFNTNAILWRQVYFGQRRVKEYKIWVEQVDRVTEKNGETYQKVMAKFADNETTIIYESAENLIKENRFYYIMGFVYGWYNLSLQLEKKCFFECTRLNEFSIVNGIEILKAYENDDLSKFELSEVMDESYACHKCWLENTGSYYCTLDNHKELTINWVGEIIKKTLYE